MSEYSFQLTGRIPSKKNSRISTRSGRSFPSKKYAEWHKDASAQLNHVAGEAIDYPVAIGYYFYLPDNRRTDLSNKVESINDLLVDIGFLEDDNAKVLTELHAYYMGVDKDNPRCNVILSQI